MRYFLTVFFITLFGLVFAQDKPIIPKNYPKEAKQSAQVEQRGTEKSPVFVKGEITTKKTEKEAEGDSKEREQKAAADAALVKYTGFSAFFAGLVLLVAIVQVGLFVWQLRLIKRATDDAGVAASAAKNSAVALMTAERAYVKLSHVPPGLNIEKTDGFFWVSEQVKNFGNTPALITDVVITFKLIAKDKALPTVLEYEKRSGRQPRQAFLVKGEEFFFNTSPQQMTAANLRSITADTHRFYVLGFVDYIDNFGCRHRAGYARVYNPDLDDRTHYSNEKEFLDRNNLVFVSQVGYNYDRPRKEGEGEDWDQEPRA